MCVSHLNLLYFDSKFQEVLSCTQIFDNNLFIDDTGPLLFWCLCCGSEGIMSTYNHSLHSVRQKLQKESFTEVCWGCFQMSKHACSTAGTTACSDITSCQLQPLNWEQTRASHFAPVKNGLFSFPRFSVGGWYHFECGFVLQTILF